MPAYRERIFICPNESGKPGWIMDFPIWWDRREFFRKFGARQIDSGDPFRVNYAILLVSWEASAWDQHCRERFSGEPRGQLPKIVNAMHQLQSRLNTASWIIVESYEWESGLE